MGFHTFDVEKAEKLEDPDRFRYCSAEEIRSLLSAAPHETVLDVGSGTGFYTEIVAEDAGSVLGLDLQPEMHDLYRDSDPAESVSLVTAGADALPFGVDSIDAAFSTMTYHEFATEDSLSELHRVLRPGGRLLTIDWDRNGPEAAGPPTEERYGLDEAVSAMEAAGFRTARAERRVETMVVLAIA